MSVEALSAAASFLFVPGNRPERFDKAVAAGADQVIIDLEDAVAPAAKAEAREAMSRWAGRTGAVVRINAPGTPWHDADIAACTSAGVGAVMAAKAEDPRQLARLHDLTGLPIVALVETALGIEDVRAVAAAPGVRRLAFGAIDLALDLGLSVPDEALDGFRLRLTSASRLAGLAAPIDGVQTDFRNADRLADDVRRAAGLGFTGKLCIHPAQVAIVSARFAPSAEAIAWATRVAAVGEDAVALAGEMIDKPVRDRARLILAHAGRLGLSGNTAG